MRGNFVIKYEFSRNPCKIKIYFLRAKTKEMFLKTYFNVKKEIFM
jgi:hypothetical protein